MILVKKNPRGKVIRELSSEEETAVKTVCGLKKPATMALHNLANDILREMREYDAWLQCDYIPGDSPAMNFAGLKKSLYLSGFNHEHAPEYSGHAVVRAGKNGGAALAVLDAQQARLLEQQTRNDRAISEARNKLSSVTESLNTARNVSASDIRR